MWYGLVIGVRPRLDPDRRRGVAGRQQSGGTITLVQARMGEPVAIALGLPGLDRPLDAVVVAVRVEIRRAGIGVRFHEPSDALSGLLRRLVVARVSA